MPIQTLTIQTNAGVNDDTYLNSGAATSNYGSSSTILSGHDQDLDGKDVLADYDYRALLRFDITSITGFTVLDATLTLFGSGSAQTLTLWRCGQPAWTEMGATWNTYDGSNAWSVLGGDRTTPNISISYGGTDAIFDATTLVLDALQNRSGILNVLVDSAVTNDNRAIIFKSFEDGAAATRPKLVINYLTPETMSGGVILGGDADWSSTVFNTTSSGGLTLGISPTDPLEASIDSFNVEQEFAWDILSSVTMGFDSQWDVGNQILRYYIVEGDCARPPTCDTTGFDPHDDACESGGSRFFQTIAATSLPDLCTKMKETYLNFPIRWPIRRIRRLSRPVYLDQGDAEDFECNETEDQVYCHIPECIEFCLDEDVLVSMGMDVVVQDTYFFYVGSGGLVVEGTANPATKHMTMGGGLVLGGGETYSTGSYNYVMDGGLLLGAETEQTSPDWHYMPGGGLIVGGGVDSNTSNFNMVAGGGLILGGEAPVVIGYVQTEVFAGLVLSGTISEPDHLGFREIPAGGLILGGSSDSNTTYYTYTADGGLLLGSEALATSPNWHYTGSGGFVLGNPDIWRYLPSGGMVLGGTSAARLSVRATGGVILGGEATVVSPDWHYTANGGMILGGSSTTDFLALGDYFIDMGADTELLLMEAQFPTDFSLVDLSSEVGLIDSSCGCDPSSNKLRMSHNVNVAPALKDFLYRNGLTLPSQLNLIYNQFDNTWRTSSHFKGKGTNINEKWSVIFEWICNVDPTSFQVEEDGPVYPGGKYWKFSALIKRDISGNVRETRILYTFPAAAACDEDQLQFSFKINTNTKAVLAPTNLAVGDSIIYDDLGLFNGRDWQKKPNLNISIFESNLPQETPTLDIQPIFVT